jgi:hypothetical protein
MKPDYDETAFPFKRRCAKFKSRIMVCSEVTCAAQRWTLSVKIALQAMSATAFPLMPE